MTQHEGKEFSAVSKPVSNHVLAASNQMWPFIVLCIQNQTTCVTKCQVWTETTQVCCMLIKILYVSNSHQKKMCVWHSFPPWIHIAASPLLRVFGTRTDPKFWLSNTAGIRRCKLCNTFISQIWMSCRWISNLRSTKFNGVHAAVFHYKGNPLFLNQVSVKLLAACSLTLTWHDLSAGESAVASDRTQYRTHEACITAAGQVFLVIFSYISYQFYRILVVRMVFVALHQN
jgi:hypothetical protein